MPRRFCDRQRDQGLHLVSLSRAKMMANESRRVSVAKLTACGSHLRSHRQSAGPPRDPLQRPCPRGPRARAPSEIPEMLAQLQCPYYRFDSYKPAPPSSSAPGRARDDESGRGSRQGGATRERVIASRAAGREPMGRRGSARGNWRTRRCRTRRRGGCFSKTATTRCAAACSCHIRAPRRTRHISDSNLYSSRRARVRISPPRAQLHMAGRRGEGCPRMAP